MLSTPGGASHRPPLQCANERAGYRRVDEPTAAQLVKDSDDQLFHHIQYNSGHILHPLLPNHRSDSYNLCDR